MAHSRSMNVLTSEEEKYYKRELLKSYETEKTESLFYILDSRLIFQTKLKKYSVKVVECGDYKSIYFYNKTHYKNDSNLSKLDKFEEEKQKKKRIISNMFDDCDLQKEKESRGTTLKEIEEKNINRSKIEMQRLVKTNMNEWKTFITLTFDDEKVDININDVSECNKIFNIWKTYISRLMKEQKKEFKYICVPEFQKRGAVHYHLLTNIDYNDFDLLCQEERKIWNKKSGWQIGRDVKGWKYGHNMAKDMKDVNVVGYLTKYMTKDIDNRLFEKRRYHYSRNLKKPSESYIDLENKEDVLFFLKSLNNMEKCFENKYFDKFENEVLFVELKTSQN